ncbi:hypothetical protein GGTG_12704 [Gaeumannomyces tritici R3-111a-1]|uniref:Uncharacterized protein n=1 Tax=Gaeumannomyces tritici (strain R3-111a-1) TaxID=644352 RepID=J3PGS5_GAET3|nr:hypothetical protein GGTG_12704 [Gaeumannomyces tritici R3-111a-1]EJT69821.1 hypothetical protein GGTG_12704 [Gaeumannomyces tritici R3-111a-1]
MFQQQRQSARQPAAPDLSAGRCGRDWRRERAAAQPAGPAIQQQPLFRVVDACSRSSRDREVGNVWLLVAGCCCVCKAAAMVKRKGRNLSLCNGALLRLDGGGGRAAGWWTGGERNGRCGFGSRGRIQF